MSGGRDPEADPRDVDPLGVLDCADRDFGVEVSVCASAGWPDIDEAFTVRRENHDDHHGRFGRGGPDCADVDARSSQAVDRMTSGGVVTDGADEPGRDAEPSEGVGGVGG